MQTLKTYFQSVGFDSTETDKITSNFKQKLFEKGDYFVNEGKTSLQMGFVEQGQFQYYSVTEQGEERTTYISLPNTFVASLLTYLTEMPARENIRALTNSSLWVINKNDVITLQNEIPKFKDFYIKLIEWQICCIDKAKFDLITLSAEQRYQKLLREEPEVLLQVPLQYIASMLGMTPRHLSRLRNNFK
ncbi:MAG TPA: Crp/Fnr family transcriptional regulator [Saprospiraceae bacterium]|nr:Crp/Fnr family transcriptional regulator [Saprospiraceae bacterium]HMP24616.1 Crp/Fnr family transcriptional regulator [Saprospiraceae bacterium]